MTPLTHKEVEEIVAAKIGHVSTFSAERLSEFIEIWKNRLDDAIHYHKNEGLRQQAQSVIEFAEKAGHTDFRLYVCSTPVFGRVGFLYNGATCEFFQIGGRTQIREPHDA